MKRLFKILLSLLVCVPVLADARGKEGRPLIDSLLQEASKGKEDTSKVMLLISLGRNYARYSQDSARYYAKKGEDLAERLHYKPGIAKGYFLFGWLAELSGDHVTALYNDSISLKFYEDIGSKRDIAIVNSYIGSVYQETDRPEALPTLTTALNTFKELNDTPGISSCLNVLGNICYNKARYPEALSYYFQAQQMYEATGNKTDAALVSANIGTIYETQKDYKDALKYQRLALAGYEETRIKINIATMLQNIAGVYSQQGVNDSAMKYYRDALQIFSEIGSKEGIGGCYEGFARIDENEQKYPEALVNLDTSLKILEQTGDKRDLARVLERICIILAAQKKYAEAERYGLRSLSAAKETGDLEQVERTNKTLSDLYTGKGDYKNALEAYKAYVTARDSVFNVANAQKILQAQLQYDFDKKESLAKTEEARKEAELRLKLQRKNILIYGSLAALMALLVIGLLLFRQSKIRAEQQKTELEQKQLRAQMNPHFIFNCLNSIQNFIVANDVQNANKYLSGFASLMRQTLENSKDGNITLRREIAYLENYLTLECMRFEDRFTTSITCAENVDKDAVEIPALIIQPFAENAIRHGLCYLQDRPGRLGIRFYMEGAQLVCEVDDNGIGRQRSREIKMNSEVVYESQGMELTRRRLELVSKATSSDYTIAITDKHAENGEPAGTTVTIKFPVQS